MMTLHVFLIICFGVLLGRVQYRAYIRDRKFDWYGSFVFLISWLLLLWFGMSAK